MAAFRLQFKRYRQTSYSVSPSLMVSHNQTTDASAQYHDCYDLVFKETVSLEIENANNSVKEFQLIY